LTWRALEDRCWRLARGLVELGVSPGDRVAFLGFNSHRLFECYYVPSRIGAISVPVNIRYAAHEMAGVLADCAPKVLFADTAHWELARQMQRETGIAFLIHADDGPAPEGAAVSHDAIADASGHGPDCDPEGGEDIRMLGSAGQDVAMLFYTGGTTGRPKGVMLSHTALFTNALGAIPIYGFRDREAQLLSGPMFHLGSGSRVFTAPLLQNLTVIVPRFEPALALQAIETHRIAAVQMVPTMLQMLLDHPDFGRHDLSSLRLVSYGAAVMPQALLARVMEALPGISFCQAFGMTECAPVVTALPPAEHYPGSKTLGTIGTPVRHVDMRIVDEAGCDVARGATGEIIVRGPNVMNGYWNQPELTAQALRGGWYHTGDAAWMDDTGFVHLAGRTVEMIVTGGENVYPVETENALALHPAVSEVAVFGLPDARWGERVHAVIRLRAGMQTDAAQLTAFCRGLVAGYKLARSYSFCNEALPQTNVGKIDKARLRREALQQTSALA